MITIITVEREYGSGGSEIAQLLSERLGWKLWDHLLTEEIARCLDDPTPERVEEELAESGLLEYVRDFLSPAWRTRGELRDA